MKPGDVLKLSDGKEYRIGKKIAEGDIADLWECSFTTDPVEHNFKNATFWDRIIADDEGEEIQAVLKIAREKTDNDLMANEARALKNILRTDDPNHSFNRYFPRLFRQELHSGLGANVLPMFSESVSLAQVMAAYPKGIDVKDMIWMVNRILEGVGYAHTVEEVHGALLPPHVLIHPESHGARIIDWCYSAQFGPASRSPRVLAMVPAYKDYYAPEIPEKKPVYPATDIYMVGKCAVALVGGDVTTNEMPSSVPGALQDFIRTWLAETQNLRPKDAWELRERFQEVCLKTVGKRKFHPFKMP